jgi:predicted Fe-Mo cluster-binding NifX family protein
MSTIALTAKAPGLDAEVEPRFGRAPYVLFLNPSSYDWEAVKNPARNAWGGAGIQLAQLLCDRRVTHVVSGEIGPKAHRVLQEAGIAMHRCEDGTQVSRAAELLREGALPPVRATEGRGGGGRGRRW